MNPGDILHLTEDDYKFSQGPLVVRVDEVHGELVTHDGRWAQVRGRALVNGEVAENRFLYVRLKSTDPSSLESPHG